MKMTKIILGMALHKHHDGLFSFCPDFDVRVKEIKNNKPENEIKIRIKRFVMLTKEQVAMLPEEFVKSSKKYVEAKQKYVEAKQKFDKPWQKYYETRQKYKSQLEEI